MFENVVNLFGFEICFSRVILLTICYECSVRLTTIMSSIENMEVLLINGEKLDLKKSHDLRWYMILCVLYPRALPSQIIRDSINNLHVYCTIYVQYMHFIAIIFRLLSMLIFDNFTTVDVMTRVRSNNFYVI